MTPTLPFPGLSRRGSKRLLLLSLFVFMLSNIVWSQHVVTGKVSSDGGEPLIGATVILQGTSIGVVTDFDGNYNLSIEESQKNGTLVVSYTGYTPQNVDINGRTSIDVKLTAGSLLEEIVVVGYGSQRSREVTGAVQKLDAEDFADAPVGQLSQKLQGRLAGVQINQTTGKPGEGMSVRIRGQASILAGSDPLYVVDGFPIVGDISAINPDEIESISVLKDAASTSLYGSRAANGVVIITTKQAKSDRTQIGVNAYYGVQSVPQKGRPQMMNAQEFAQFKKETAEDLGVPVPGPFQNPSQYSESYDWYDGMLQTAPIQNYSVSFSSVGDRFSTSAVGGLFSQDGVMRNSNFKRISLRLNTTFKATEKLNIGFNLAPNYSINNTPSSDGAFYATNISAVVPGGLLYNALLTWPVFPYENSDGTRPLTAWIPGISAFPTPNWYNALNEITNETNTSRLLSNAYVELEVLEGLKLKSSVNVELGNTNFTHFNPSTVSTTFAALPPVIAASLKRNDRYYSWLNENTATYAKSINGDHNLELLVGYTAQKFSANTDQIRLTGFPDDRIQTTQSAQNVDRVNTFTDVQEWSLLSYVSRLTYNYRGRYLFSAAIRRDGSSRFGTENRWGNFPSVSLGWIVSEEGFMQNSGALNFLKLRASYGVIGNNNIGNYTQYPLVDNTTNAIFGNTVASGASVVSLGNIALGWETTRQLDIGVDFGFLDDRVTLSYDYYTKKTDNLLYNVAVPQESGFSSFNDNVGVLKFWGHEFSINSKNLVGSFTWTTNLNISTNKNEVVELAPGIDRIYGGFGAYQTITEVGQPIGQFYGLIQEGVYVNQADFDGSPQAIQSQVGTVKYTDANGDGMITYGGDSDDRVVIGNPFPKALFGIVNTFGYKNFDLSIVAQGSVGSDVAVMSDQGTTNLDGVFNVLADVKNRWRSPENPGDGRYGKTTAATFMERDWFSTRFIESGDYLTIKNITLGYTLPLNNSVKGLKSLRIYGSIQQALVFTQYRGSNPEVSSSANGQGGSTLNLGMDWATYPVPRTFTLGLNVGL